MMSSSRGGRSCTRMETLTEVGQEQGGIEARGRERGLTSHRDLARLRRGGQLPPRRHTRLRRGLHLGLHCVHTGTHLSLRPHAGDSGTQE